MAVKTIHTTQQFFEGPWLLERSALIELDQHFNEWFEGNQAAFDEEAEAEFQRRFTVETTFGAKHKVEEQELRDEIRAELSRYAPQKLATLHFGRSKKLQARSILEMEVAPEVLSERATGLDLTISRGGTSPEVSVQVNANGLRLSADQNASSDSAARFATLHRWAVENSAPLFQQWWVSGYLLWMAILFVACSLTLIVAIPTASDTMREKGRALAAQGVTDGNRDEALRLLLAIESNYVETPNTAWNHRALAILGGLLLLGMVLAIRPTIVIGLGSGAQLLKRWRLWLKLLFAFVPASIILPFVINILAARWR